MEKTCKLSLTDTTAIFRVSQRFDVNFHALGGIFLSNVRHPHTELYQLNLDTFFPRYGIFICQELNELMSICQDRYQSFETVRTMYLTPNRLVIIYEDTL